MAEAAMKGADLLIRCSAPLSVQSALHFLCSVIHTPMEHTSGEIWGH